MWFESAREILAYALSELERALKTRDDLLYRNVTDKVFLALVVAVNEYIRLKMGVTPKSLTASAESF